MGQFGFVEKSWLPGGVRFCVCVRVIMKSSLFSKDPGSFGTILTRDGKNPKKSDQIRVRGGCGPESRGRAVVRPTGYVLRLVRTCP